MLAARPDGLKLALGLSSSVKELPKVGPADSTSLAQLGIKTIRDLLLHLPFAWDEYGEPTAVASLKDGTQATVIGTVETISARKAKYKKLRWPTRRCRMTRANPEGGLFNQPGWSNRSTAGRSHQGRGHGQQAVRRLEMRNPL